MKRTYDELKAEIMDMRDRVDDWRERNDQEDKMIREWYQELEVGDRAHICHYSDITPCTVIKRTKASITVRHDDGDLDPNWKPDIIPGGFAGHCVNNHDQKWILREDPNGCIETFRWSSRRGCFKNQADERVIPGWAKFYDYNF